MARDAKVQVVLTANDQASGPIKNVHGALGGLKGQMSGANSMAGVLAGGLAGIATGIGISAITELGAAMMDLGRQGEQAKLLGDSFDTLAASVGQSSAQMLDAMRAASGGMINDQDLILSANRAMMLGVADSSAEMSQLLEVAAVRGRAMGLSTSQAFNDLVTGLGRMSPLILDNLGIVTGGEKVFEEYAASVNKTAASLSDAERKQALLNKVIEQTDTSGGVVVSQFERMDAAIQNAKTALGELFSPAVAQIAQNLADAVNEAVDAMSTDAIEAAQNNLQVFGNEAVALSQKLQSLRDESAVAQVGGDKGEFARVQQEIDNTTTSLQVYVDNYNQAARVTGAPLLDIDALKNGEVAFLSAADAAALLATQATTTAQNTDQLKAAMILAGYASAGFASGLSQVQAQAGATAGIIYNLTGAVQQLNAATGVMRANSDLLSGVTGQVNGITSGLINNLGIDGALAKGEELKTQYREQIEQLREQGYTTDEIRLILQANVSETQKWASSLDQVNTATSDIESAMSSLQGKVFGAVQAATQADVGLDPADYLPREDAVNENARRLAAIMRDGITDQPWLEEFKNEVPAVFNELVASGDPKAAAAKIMQDFQAGLRPELLDLGAIKEQIKNEIAGEAAMQATAAQITAELVADTGGDSADIQAKVAKALGLGVDQVDITGGILGDLNSATFNSQLVTAATGAGKGWGNTFLATVGSNVPGELVNILVNLVTPGVQANLNQTQSQTTPAGSIYDLHH